MERGNADNLNRDPIKILHGLAAIGLTTPFVIGVVTGIPTDRIDLLIKGNIVPIEFETRALAELVNNYAVAITIVNADTLRREIVSRNVSNRCSIVNSG